MNVCIQNFTARGVTIGINRTSSGLICCCDIPFKLSAKEKEKYNYMEYNIKMLVYNLSSHAYGSAIGDILTMVSIGTAIYRYDIRGKKK